MKTQSLAGILVAVICHLKGIGAARLFCPYNNQLDWSYDGTTNGPSHWGEKYPACQDGKRQSPIDIITTDTDKSIKPLKTHNFNIPVQNTTIVNAGESVAIRLQDGVNRSIQVDNHFHNLISFVLRFGSSACRGSDHTIDGERYALEIRFLHVSSEGVYHVPLSVLYKQVEENNPAFQSLIDVLPGIRFKNQITRLASPLNLRGIVPENPISVFQYDGSFPTPPCTPPIKLSIAKEIQPIGRSQMDEIRKLYSVPDEEHGGPSDPSNCKMMNNYRPLQPLNGRVVYESP